MQTYEAQKSDRAFAVRSRPPALRAAIQHSPKGGAVSVILSQMEKEGERFAVVEISDKGPGVSEDELDSILLRSIELKSHAIASLEAQDRVIYGRNSHSIVFGEIKERTRS